MELSLLLSLIGTLGALWVYLYRLIMDLTVSAPSDQTLFFLGIMHYIVLAYLALALYVFYKKGIQDTEQPKSKARVEIVTGILLHTWPITIAVLLSSFLSAKLVLADIGWKAVMIFIVIAAFAVPLYRGFRTSSSNSSSSFRAAHMGWFLGSLLPGGIIYVVAMSFILSDVQITTDKEFYKANEPVVVSVRAAGYIFRPSVTKLKFGVYEKTNVGDETVMVLPEEHLSDDLIIVDFVPQVFPAKRTAYHNVKMVKRK